MPDEKVQTSPQTLVISTTPKGQTPPKKGPKARRQQKTRITLLPRRTPTPALDTDETPPNCQLSESKSATCPNGQTTSISVRPTEQTIVGNINSGRELAQIRPKLCQLSEVSGSKTKTEGVDVRKRGAAGSVRRAQHSDGPSATSNRRSRKSDAGRVTKRNDCGFKLNPSLLSVLTNLTTASDQSSGSNTTVTQESHDRHSKEIQTMSPASRTRRSVPEQRPSSPPMQPQKESNSVFQYMDPPSTDEMRDDRSDASSPSESEYEASDAGSSEQPDTPSSRSTFPSPTATRSGSINGHVAEMRRKYDSRSATSGRSIRGESISTETNSGVNPKPAQVNDVASEYCISPQPSNAEPRYDSRTRSSSRLSSVSQRSEEQLQQREEAMRQHMAYAQAHQYADPAYAEYMHQQYMASMGEVGQQPYQQQQMALQHYHHPAPPAQMNYPTPPHSMTGHVSPVDRPPAPDAPDLTKRTLTGYEKLALELSNAGSSIKPVYRRFDYLHHRLLLHIQDEMCELEEQLRLVDEIVAQTEAAQSPGGSHIPSSRRGDANSTLEIHHRRTELLGRIFLKQEQYSRAMTSYASMNRECCSAEPSQVDAYKAWLAKQAPIHEGETKFLQKVDDLILPGVHKEMLSTAPPYSVEGRRQRTKQMVITYAPFALLLPLLLYALIPTFGGRLVVTALIAVGGAMVVSATQLWNAMPANEWAVCGGAYVLLMTAIAGCIPQHA